MYVVHGEEMFSGGSFATAFLFIFLLFSTVSYAEKTDGKLLLFVNPEVNATTNIHYNKYYCIECHQESERQEHMTMRFNDFITTCRCHNYTPETYTHPVGIRLSPEKAAKIPTDFPLIDNTITCATCHVMTLQCDPDSDMKKSNGSFLRVNPHLPRTTICYKCHNETKYTKMNPHNQLDNNGMIVKEKCLYCHKRLPDVNRSSSGNFKEIEELVAPIGKLDALCYRCHYKKTQLHPINANHLKKPSKRIRANIKRSERKLGIVMPLDAKGNITCVTCHNPHERGVIPTSLKGATGAGSVGRLRVPRAGDKICLACHHKN